MSLGHVINKPEIRKGFDPPIVSLCESKDVLMFSKTLDDILWVNKPVPVVEIVGVYRNMKEIWIKTV